MPAAIARLKRTIGRVRSATPNQIPSATPVSAPCAMVSLKKAMRRAVTNTPSKAQTGPSSRAAARARCMKASVSMRRSVVMMVIGRDVDAVSFLQRIGVHDVGRRAFAADFAIQRVNPGGVAEHHREIVRDENDG